MEDGTYFCMGWYAHFDERKIPWQYLEKVEEKAEGEGEVVDSPHKGSHTCSCRCGCGCGRI